MCKYGVYVWVDVCGIDNRLFSYCAVYVKKKETSVER